MNQKEFGLQGLLSPFIRQIMRYLEMIKFGHTVFALPFALVAALVAAQGWPTLGQCWWVILAMAGARSGAMGFNRLVDRRFDAANPRTANRPSVTGEISPKAMIAFVVVSYLLLVIAAYKLNPLAFYLSPVAILITAFYSYTKRFTAYSHLFLGLAIGSAPVAAWIAIDGTITLAALALGLSVLCWIAGFDILYALQDLDVDTDHGLHSLPKKLGVAQSILVSRCLHGGTVLLWLLFYALTSLNGVFLVGIALAAGMLIYEHRLVSPHDLSKLNLAFFNMNGLISLNLLLFTILAL